MASAAVTAAKKRPSFEIRRDPALNSFFEAWSAAVCSASRLVPLVDWIANVSQVEGSQVRRTTEQEGAKK